LTRELGGEQNLVQDGVQSREYFLVAHAKNADPDGREEFGALDVFFCLARFVVDASIYLYGEFVRGAVKVQHHAPDGVLPSEAEPSVASLAQAVPEPAFRRSHFRSQATSGLEDLRCSPAHPPPRI
jgi:hypothetical protein